MTENLSLWNAVETTPPSHTKPITGKAYQGTSPKPYHLVQKATETFGPCGIGWGFTIEDERVEEGAGGERLHVARVKVWYEWNGKRGEVEHIGGTQFCGTRNNGKHFTDEDAPKKSVTDALVKALSMIGFAGDIFMGRYDDSKYVNELRREEASNDSNSVPTTGRNAPAAGPRTTAAGAPLTADAMIVKIKTFKLVSDMFTWSNSGPVDQAFRSLPEAEQERVSAAFNAHQAQIESPFQEAAE